MDETLQAAEVEAWRAFLAAHTSVVPAVDEALNDEAGLTLSQYQVLSCLAAAEAGALRMSDLAERVFLSMSGATRAIDQLERKTLVERKVCPSDRRGTFAVLTSKGRERLDRASRAYVAEIRRHFTTRLSGPELERLTGLLARLT